MGFWAPDTDLLTGAWTRQRFEAELARAVSQANRARSPLALLRVDVDDTQELNDLHGWEALDGALGRLAEVLSQVVDGRGQIARVGGDEFAVILPQCTREVAVRTANAVLDALRLKSHPCADGQFQLTASAGVATARPGEPWGNLVEAAESACVRAKQGGRNAVASR